MISDGLTTVLQHATLSHLELLGSNYSPAQKLNILPDICLKRQGLAGLLAAVPVTGTLVVKVLRLTEMFAVTKHTATALMGLCRT